MLSAWTPDLGPAGGRNPEPGTASTDYENASPTSTARSTPAASVPAEVAGSGSPFNVAPCISGRIARADSRPRPVLDHHPAGLQRLDRLGHERPQPRTSDGCEASLLAAVDTSWHRKPPQSTSTGSTSLHFLNRPTTPPSRHRDCPALAFRPRSMRTASPSYHTSCRSRCT